MAIDLQLLSYRRTLRELFVEWFRKFWCVNEDLKKEFGRRNFFTLSTLACVPEIIPMIINTYASPFWMLFPSLKFLYDPIWRSGTTKMPSQPGWHCSLVAPSDTVIWHSSPWRSHSILLTANLSFGFTFFFEQTNLMIVCAAIVLQVMSRRATEMVLNYCQLRPRSC